MTFASGQLIVALASPNRSIEIVDLGDDGRHLCSLHQPALATLSLERISSHLLAVGSSDNSIRIWDTSSGKCALTLAPKSGGGVSALRILGNSDRLASGYRDGSICVWSVQLGRCLSTLNGGHTRAIVGLADVSDRELASASVDGRITVWNLDTGRTMRTMGDVHSTYGSIVCMIFANQQRLACGQQFGTIQLWSVHTFKVVRSLAVVRCHDSVTSLQMLGDSQQLASAYEDALIRVWNLDNGECVRTLRGHTGPVLALDIFLVQAAANTLLSHFVGAAASLWMLRAISD